MVTIQKSIKNQTGYQVRGRFSICLHAKDYQILDLIKNYFTVGSIVKHGNYVHYIVTSLPELVDFIIPLALPIWGGA